MMLWRKYSVTDREDMLRGMLLMLMLFLISGVESSVLLSQYYSTQCPTGGTSSTTRGTGPLCCRRGTHRVMINTACLLVYIRINPSTVSQEILWY